MEYGLMVEPQVGGTYDDQVRLAQWAETNDVTVFARSDHYLMGDAAPATDAFAALAGLARDTNTVKLCVLVSPISFRHPALIAKMAATIDEMSEGRLSLGVGAGWYEGEHDAFGLELWPVKERFERLEEALQYLTAAFGQGAASVKGKYYSLTDVDVLPKPTNLPIIVGGSGPKKTPTLAGTYADEYNQFIDHPDKLSPRFAVCRNAAEAAGRNPDDVLVSIASSAIYGSDDADYRERLGRGAAEREITPEEFESRLEERNILHGTSDRIRDKLAELTDIGVGRFYLQFFSTLGAITEDELDRAFGSIRG